MNTATEADDILIVAKANRPKNLKTPPSPPPHPYSYYGCFNFIFDTDGTLYFYQHLYDSKRKPVTVIDFDNNEPVFINLNPDQIVIIPEAGLKSFVEQNILRAPDGCKDVRIIGTADTIQTKSLNLLREVLNNPKNGVHSATREITYEEEMVLNFKKRGEYFYPDRVNWDSTKILFDRKR